MLWFWRAGGKEAAFYLLFYLTSLIIHALLEGCEYLLAPGLANKICINFVIKSLAPQSSKDTAVLLLLRDSLKHR